jgi:hypothetical protein
MALDERQLAVILQASIDRASELLGQAGGFLPFGARARLDGRVEFLEAQRLGEGESLDELYRRIGAMLAEEAGREEILAAALVANATMASPGSPTAISVQVEAPEFCRSIVVPYRIAQDTVELGMMIPGEAEPAVFAG